MTPLDVARGLSAYTADCIKQYDETLRVIDAAAESSSSTDVRVYAGFLPRASSRKEMQELCPAIVFRPEEVTDSADSSTVSIVSYVTVYDEDKQYGADVLFHYLEFLRMMLLSQNPINDKWFISGGLKCTVPDEQPFPQWIGVIEFEVYIDQPKKTQSTILGGAYLGR